MAKKPPVIVELFGFTKDHWWLIVKKGTKRVYMINMALGYTKIIPTQEYYDTMISIEPNGDWSRALAHVERALKDKGGDRIPREYLRDARTHIEHTVWERLISSA